jgi:hypothetical protein
MRHVAHQSESRAAGNGFQTFRTANALIRNETWNPAFALRADRVGGGTTKLEPSWNGINLFGETESFWERGRTKSFLRNRGTQEPYVRRRASGTSANSSQDSKQEKRSNRDGPLTSFRNETAL